MKKLICRICGKNGFDIKNIKIKLSSGILDTSKINKKCTNCNSAYVDDHHFEKILERNFVKNKKLTKEGLEFLDELEFKKQNRVKKIYKEKANKNNSKFIFKSISLIPDKQWIEFYKKDFAGLSFIKRILLKIFLRLNMQIILASLKLFLKNLMPMLKV
jgi:ribosomal protein L4